MTITIEQAADLVISGPGDVREKIIAGIEAYMKSLPSEQLCEDEGCPHRGVKHVCIVPPATPDKVAVLTSAAEDVLAERRRQVDAEGWTPGHDDEHTTGAMAAAAACYALWASAPGAENAYWYATREEAAKMLWPWDREWWKPKSNRRDLVKAGALILAEIERLDRAALASVQGGA